MKAFSFIEWLVVIAIVGLLSTLAIPLYRNYTISAKFHTVIPIIDNFLQQQISKAVKDGYFSSVQINDPSTLSAYLAPELNFMDISQKLGSPNACGRAANVNVQLNSQLLGLPAGSTAILNCYIAHKNDVMATKCFYSYAKNGAKISTSNFSGGGLTLASTGKVFHGITNAGDLPYQQALVADFLQGSTCLKKHKI